MATVTLYYSASEKDIIAVVGDLEPGALALGISGVNQVPELNTLADAKAATPYIEADIKRIGSLAFLVHGGPLNESAPSEMAAEGYEAFHSFEV